MQHSLLDNRLEHVLSSLAKTFPEFVEGWLVRYSFDDEPLKFGEVLQCPDNGPNLLKLSSYSFNQERKNYHESLILGQVPINEI